MTPIIQTKLVTTHEFGNCFPAVIASLMDIRLEDVPNIEVLYGLKGDDAHFWLEVLNKWLASKGLHWRLSDSHKMVFHDMKFDYESDMHEFAKSRGVYDVLYIAVGKSSRGVMHCVICKNGTMIHDPHPSNEGIVDVQYCEVIESL